MKPCKNCNAPMQARYCSECGQKDVDLERPFPQLLGELLYETFDIDGRAARTLRTLFSRPGVLTEQFLSGHRQKYTSPVRLYLIISVVFFLVMAWVVRRGILFPVNPESAGEVRVLAENMPALMFIFLPAFALLLKFAFRRRLYFDHLIHALHLHAAAYVVLTLMLPIERVASHSRIWLVAQIALAIYLAVYLYASFRLVYKASRGATLVKGFAVLLSYIMILAVSLEFASTLNF